MRHHGFKDKRAGLDACLKYLQMHQAFVIGAFSQPIQYHELYR